MKSDVILVSSDGGKLEKALDLTERVVAYWRLPPKMALHLRLLTEELMGMMHGITGERYGDFWIEVESGICMLHLRTETTMDSEKREALLAAASDGSGRTQTSRRFRQPSPRMIRRRSATSSTGRSRSSARPWPCPEKAPHRRRKSGISWKNPSLRTWPTMSRSASVAERSN